MNSLSRSQPKFEHENWVLHRQPADQIVDHKFSIWSGEHPVVLANEAVGEDGALAYIVSELNSIASLKARIEELEGALEEICNRAGNHGDPDACDWMPSIYKIATAALEAKHD